MHRMANVPEYPQLMFSSMNNKNGDKNTHHILTMYASIENKDNMRKIVKMFKMSLCT